MTSSSSIKAKILIRPWHPGYICGVEVMANNPKGRVPRACPWVNVRGGDTVV